MKEYHVTKGSNAFYGYLRLQ